MAEHLLHRFHVRPFPHKESRQAVAQVVEPEAYLLALPAHTRLHGNWTEIVFDEYVGHAGSLILEPGAGKHAGHRLTVGRLLLPLANEASE